MLSLEQINENRAKAGLTSIAKRVPGRPERKRLHELLKKQIAERKQRLKAIDKARKETRSLIKKTKDNMLGLKKSQQERDFLVRKKACAERLIEYLSNPDNPPVKKRAQYLKIAGYSKHGAGPFRKMFPLDELVTIEDTALTNRRKQYASRLAAVDDGLLNRAQQGFAAEASLSFQKYEGWSPKAPPPLTVSPVIVFPMAPPKSIAEWQQFIESNNMKENSILTQQIAHTDKEVAIDVGK